MTKGDADELHLYATNEADLYRQYTLPIQAELAQRKRAGTYRREDAVARFLPMVDKAAERWNRDVGRDPDARRTFSPAVRREVAGELAERFEVEYGLGNVDPSRSRSKHSRYDLQAAQTPAEIERDVGAIAGKRASDRAKHGYDADPISDREFEQSARFDAKKYGIKHEEALRFVKHPSYLSIRSEVERWREQHGFPAPNSPLTRGHLLDKLRVKSVIAGRGRGR